jgi:hypothetical protein
LSAFVNGVVMHIFIRVDVAGVLDPKVPLLVLSASTLDTHLLAVPSLSSSFTGQERSIAPLVLQVRCLPKALDRNTNGASSLRFKRI